MATNIKNAERLRSYFLSRKQRKDVVNVCRAMPNWDGCDYCDLYAGSGFPCWKQDGKSNCCKVEEVKNVVSEVKNTAIKIHFEDAQGNTNTVTTSINGTPEQISRYYLNNWFNFPDYEDKNGLDVYTDHYYRGMQVEFLTNLG